MSVSQNHILSNPFYKTADKMHEIPSIPNVKSFKISQIASQAPAFSSVLHKLKTKKLFQQSTISVQVERDPSRQNQSQLYPHQPQLNAMPFPFPRQQTNRMKESLNKSLESIGDNMNKSMEKENNEYASTEGFPSTHLQYIVKIQEFQHEIKVKNEKLEQLTASNLKLEQLLEYYQQQTEIANINSNRIGKESKQKDEYIRKLHNQIQQLSKAFKLKSTAFNQSQNNVLQLKVKLNDQEFAIAQLERKVLDLQAALRKYEEQQNNIMNQNNFQKMINFYQHKIEKMSGQFEKERQIGQHQINGLIYKLQIQQKQIQQLHLNLQKLHQLSSKRQQAIKIPMEIQLAQQYFHRFNSFASNIQKRLGKSAKSSERTTHSNSMIQSIENNNILEQISILLKKNKQLQDLIKKSMLRNEQLRKQMAF